MDNITNESWEIIDNLLDAANYPRTVIYKKYIIIIGFSTTKDVQIIDCISNTVRLAGLLKYAVTASSLFLIYYDMNTLID